MTPKPGRYLTLFFEAKRSTLSLFVKASNHFSTTASTAHRLHFLNINILIEIHTTNKGFKRSSYSTVYTLKCSNILEKIWDNRNRAKVLNEEDFIAFLKTGWVVLANFRKFGNHPALTHENTCNLANQRNTLKWVVFHFMLFVSPL